MDNEISINNVGNNESILLNNSGIPRCDYFFFVLMFPLMFLLYSIANNICGLFLSVIPISLVVIGIRNIIWGIPKNILLSDEKIIANFRFGITREYQWDQLDRIVSNKPVSSWFSVMFSIPSLYPEYHPPSTKGFMAKPEIGALLNQIKYDKLSISEVKSNYDYLLSTEPEFNPIHERERIMETLPMANTVFYLHFGFIPIPFTAYYRGVIPMYILIIIYVVWTISLIYVFRMKRKLRSELVSLSTVINNTKVTDD